MTDSTNHKLLVLTSSFPVSSEAGDNFISTLCHKIASHFEITVLAPHVKGARFKETINNLNIIRYRVSPFGNLGLTQKSGIPSNLKRSPWLILLTPCLIYNQVMALKRSCRENGVGFVQAHWLIPSGFSAAMYKYLFASHVRLLITVHGSDIYKFNIFPFNLIKKFTLNQADAVTTVSQDLKDKVIAYGYKKPISVIPMGVDTDLFTPEKFDPNLASIFTKPILLFVGTVVKSKGIFILVKSLPEILKHYPTATLLVIGDGYDREEAEIYAKLLHVENSIKFLGRIRNDELPRYQATGNLLVLPSLSEGFPVVVAEALSSGNICVTSDLPVFDDLARQGEFLVTSKSKDSKDLAQKIVEVLGLPQNELEQIRTSARKYAQEYLSWDKTVSDYLKLINENINNH